MYSGGADGERFWRRCLALALGGFLPGSRSPPTEDDDWPDIIQQIEQLQQRCVSVQGVPGWARVGQYMGTFKQRIYP